MSLLEIRDLSASAGDKEILRGITLSVRLGEVHAIMGPNGSGKSTLAQVLAGHPAYEVTGGSVTYEGQDLLDMDPEVRAQAGLFLAFQYPVEIPGVSNAYFLRSAYNDLRYHTRFLGDNKQPLLDSPERFYTEEEQHAIADRIA